LKGPLGDFIAKNENKTPVEIGEELSVDEGINAIHAKLYMNDLSDTPVNNNQGDSNANKHSDGQEDRKTNNHFICYTFIGGKLFEFNGIAEEIIEVVPYDPKNLLKSIVDWIKIKYIKPNLNFSLLALSGDPTK
jgi:hypothetical protein